MAEFLIQSKKLHLLVGEFNLFTFIVIIILFEIIYNSILRLCISSLFFFALYFFPNFHWIINFPFSILLAHYLHILFILSE